MGKNVQTQKLLMFYSVSMKKSIKISLVFNLYFILFIFFKKRLVRRPDANWRRSVRRKRKAFRGAHRYRECGCGAAVGFIGASALANRVGKRRAPEVTEERSLFRSVHVFSNY